MIQIIVASQALDPPVPADGVTNQHPKSDAATRYAARKREKS